MDDLNDYLYFTEVVAHGGFSAASRATLVPKSKLSRRVAELERAFGVTLIERSPHSFRVTPAGQDFYDHCRAMRLEAERAKVAVCMAKSNPAGVLRLSCPTVLLDACVSAVIPEFLALYPEVELHVLAVDRPVDLVQERIHVAIRPVPGQFDDADLNVTRLGPSRDVLVAHPSLAESHDVINVAAVKDLPTISLREPESEWVETDVWDLSTDDGESVAVAHRPRLLCRSVPAALQAVQAGVGVGLLPEKSCGSQLAKGDLVRVWPQWSRLTENIGLITTNRRGLPAAVVALVDFLTARLGPN